MSRRAVVSGTVKARTRCRWWVAPEMLAAHRTTHEQAHADGLCGWLVAEQRRAETARTGTPTPLAQLLAQEVTE
ncbi:hypothetical protein ACIQU6_41425 [Streptomyces sp. NPDC090442]|uniref:hypothetical protein n=1 Tax=Streptomyces sp. NPDC090442 TaxID=3365962 RepID=UPI00381C46F5